MAKSISFREIPLGAVDYGLTILGASVRQAVYDRLERSHGIERRESPMKLMLFRKASTPVIRAGGNVVDRLIARSLHGQLGPDFSPHQESVLVDYVGHAPKSEMIAPTHNSSPEVNSDG